MFRTELLVFLGSSCPSFGGLLQELLEAGQVGRRAVRLFCVPRGFIILLQFACGLLCGASNLGEKYLPSVFPEITWDGCASVFPLDFVLPSDGLCEILVVIRQSHRRSWSQFSRTPVCEKFSHGTAVYFIHELYKSIMPWYAPLQSAYPQYVIHVHRTVYHCDSSSDRRSDYEEVLNRVLHECALALFYHAELATCNR
jgi:hypothetical protein